MAPHSQRKFDAERAIIDAVRDVGFVPSELWLELELSILEWHAAITSASLDSLRRHRAAAA